MYVRMCACVRASLHACAVNESAIKSKTKADPQERSYYPQKKKRNPSQKKAVKCYVFSGSTLNRKILTRHDALTPLRPSTCNVSQTWATLGSHLRRHLLVHTGFTLKGKKKLSKGESESKQRIILCITGAKCV